MHIFLLIRFQTILDMIGPTYIFIHTTNQICTLKIYNTSLSKTNFVEGSLKFMIEVTNKISGTMMVSYRFISNFYYSILYA
jgi:hypothetical protein